MQGKLSPVNSLAIQNSRGGRGPILCGSNEQNIRRRLTNPVDPEDAEEIGRLNRLFFDGCRLSEEHAASSCCEPR